MWLIILCVVAIIIVITFVIVLPRFGGKPSGESYKIIKQSQYFKDNGFKNYENTPMMTEFEGKIFLEFLNGNDVKPKNEIPVEKYNFKLLEGKENTKVTWFGHSTLFLEIDNKKIFLDPMFSSSAAPVSILGFRRFNKQLPMEIDEVPELDAILISHDHYDHLDYSSIKKLKDRTKKFYVPLGVGVHLKTWGVDESKIIELDWWEESEFDGLKFICTPTRHSSGRGLYKKNSTLWCSWVIKGKENSLFFSGDTGYMKQFKEIGEKYGPFDLTLIECGQYNDAWPFVHMKPEETVQAHIDLKGELLLPIHWAAFKLSTHPWNESVERVLKEANSLNVNVTTPKIGETIVLGESVPDSKWWRGLKK